MKDGTNAEHVVGSAGRSWSGVTWHIVRAPTAHNIVSFGAEKRYDSAKKGSIRGSNTGPLAIELRLSLSETISIRAVHNMKRIFE